MEAESLKEYLVKLGWDVDELGLSKAKEKLKGFETNISSMGNTISGNFLKAGSAVTSFITISVVAMGKLLDVVAQADLSVERFARKMWTTEESARSFLSALDAMNADYSDIFYMTPEEYKRFMDLRELGNSLKAPEGLQEGLRLVRDIRGEFSKLKVIANYATQWTSYYLTKYLETDLTKIRDGFASFNDWIIQNIPSATEKIAKFFTIVFKLGKTALKTIKNIATAFKDFFDMLSPKAKGAGAAILGFVGLLKLGPIGLFIAGLVALLAIMDDLYTWMNGGKSAYGDTWQKLADMFSSWDTSGVDDLGEKFDGLLVSLWNVLDAIGDIGTAIFDFLEEMGVFEAFWNGALTTLNTVADVLQTIADLILLITGNFDKMSENSIFRKIIKFDESGNFDVGSTLASVGSSEEVRGGLSAFARLPFNPLSGPLNIIDWITGDKGQKSATSGFQSRENSGLFGSGETSFGSSRSGGFGSSGQVTQSQTNNINVYGSTDEAAAKTGKRIIENRKYFTPFN